MKVDLTTEEIEDLLMNLDQCLSEGYINYGDPSYSVIDKLNMCLTESHGEN